MLLNLTDLSNEPLQSQIIRQIRAKILAGEMTAGDSIPSIRTLARINHISVITVQRAYEYLEREGLIHSRRGKGFFISDLKPETRKEMAETKLAEQINPIIKSALCEGLNATDIIKTIKKLLKK